VVGGDGAPVPHPGERLEHAVEHCVRRRAADGGDEADAAGIALGLVRGVGEAARHARLSSFEVWAARLRFS
jgi:hypothetical protein